MPLRIAEKDGWLKAVDKCKDCLFCFKMLTGVKNHLAGKYPSGFGCFHDDITTRKEIGKETKLDCIPVWCPLPRGEKGV